jgi:hypothetical protein
LVTHENALRTSADIKAVAELIHAAAKEKIDVSDPWFHVDALEGALSHSTGGTMVIS